MVASDFVERGSENETLYEHLVVLTRNFPLKPFETDTNEAGLLIVAPAGHLLTDAFQRYDLTPAANDLQGLAANDL